MSTETLTMLAVGDLYLHGQPPAEPLFAKVAPVLRSADVAVGHGSVCLPQGASIRLQTWAWLE